MFYEYVKCSAAISEVNISVLNIKVNPNEVSFIFDFSDPDKTIIEHKVTLQDLRSANGFTDMTTLMLPFDKEFKPLYLVNTIAESMLTKQYASSLKAYCDSPLRVFFKVFQKDSDFNDISLRVMLPEGLKIESNVPFQEVPKSSKAELSNGNSTLLKNRLIIPKISGPVAMPANTVAELIIEPHWLEKPLDKPVTVYLRHEAGYLPKKVIECHGKTAFKVHSLGLEAGDKIEINAGFRFLTGQFYHTIEVV